MLPYLRTSFPRSLWYTVLQKSSLCTSANHQCPVVAENTPLVAEQLNRSVIEVDGEEVAPFLQGLITNDINHLRTGTRSMYCMLLNIQGRVLSELILYSGNKENLYLLECPKDITETVQKHLKLYRVRRKISITCLDKQIQPWVVYPSNLDRLHIQDNMSTQNAVSSSPDFSSCEPQDIGLDTSKLTDCNAVVVKDPRLPELGWRVLLPDGTDITQILPNVSVSDDTLNYTQLRYKLGVAEGVNEIPPGKCFPLEYNCDYLHGVSFHKGCYIGQELTARTHHTGVIRKRLMPLLFPSAFDEAVKLDTAVVSDKGKSVGKVRAAAKMVGLGLMRIEDSLKANTLSLMGQPVMTCRPHWWPVEASKKNLLRRQE